MLVPLHIFYSLIDELDRSTIMVILSFLSSNLATKTSLNFSNVMGNKSVFLVGIAEIQRSHKELCKGTSFFRFWQKRLRQLLHGYLLTLRTLGFPLSRKFYEEQPWFPQVTRWLCSLR